MPRHARVKLAGQPWHVIQRGVNRCPCFVGPGDRLHYLSLLTTFAARHGCHVHAYVLMPNHVHLLLTPADEDGVSRMMKCIGERYVPAFNRSHGRTGTLWEGRFRSNGVDSLNYLFTCQRYIELNPVRAALVRHPRDFEWSSYRANAEGAKSDVITPHPLYFALAETSTERLAAYSALFGRELRDEELGAIRKAAIGGRILGSASLKWGAHAAVGMRIERRRTPQ
jgi:putative transposase